MVKFDGCGINERANSTNPSLATRPAKGGMIGACGKSFLRFYWDDGVVNRLKREEIGKKEGKMERNVGDIVKTVDRARSGRSISTRQSGVD